MTTAIVQPNYIIQPAKAQCQTDTPHGDCGVKGRDVGYRNLTI
jgi:hypothetical protein